MSVVYEIDYDLRGEAGERREDYTVLDERINLLGDALRIEYSSWFVEVSASLPMVEAYLKKTLRSDDRLLVCPAPRMMAGQGFSDEQRRWLAAHGIQILGASFAFLMVERFEAELLRKKQLRDALRATVVSHRRAFVPPTASTSVRSSLTAALEPLLRPQPQPASNWLGALGLPPRIS